MTSLRPYQETGKQEIRRAMAAGKRNVLLQASCGAGKTIISADIVKSAIEKGSKVLFLVNRRDLVKQTVEKYTQYGLGEYLGVIMAGEQSALDMPVQIASLQTYGRRLNFEEPEFNAWFHKANLVIYDECHSCNAKTYKKIIDLYKGKAYIIGLSATPMRGDGSGLGEVFDTIIECIPTKELIEMGHLVPMVYYAPSKPDLERLRIIAGDYDKKELSERVNKPKLIGDIYDNWARLAYDRQTIIFATDVKHSKYIRDYFRGKGVSIEHIDAHTTDEEREEFYRNFENGDIQVMTNVGIATEGSDLPYVSAIVVARPTRVLGKWLQMAGRGARPSAGKKDCILLDHAGCVEAHGFIEDPICWTLDGKMPAAKKVKKKEKKEPKPITCEMCKHVFSIRKTCPQCGFEVGDYGKKVKDIQAELEEVGESTKKEKYTTADKRRWWQMFEYERRRLGKSESWLKAQYRSKFGVWPNGVSQLGPVEPDQAVLGWLKYQRIKWIKSKQKQEAVAA